MSKGTVARIFLAGLLGLSLAGAAYADRGGHGGGRHFEGRGGFHPGYRHFEGDHFRSRIFIGGSFVAPFYYPRPYYQPYYYYPPPAPAPVYWWYCAPYGAYYPYVQDCPGGWQPVVPPPS